MKPKQPKSSNSVVWVVIVALIVLIASASITTYFINRSKAGPSTGEKAEVSMELVPPTTTPRKVTIFVAVKDGDSFALEPKIVESQEQGPEPDVALDCLLKEGQKLVESVELIPQGTTRLKPIEIDKETATINLSQKFIDNFSGGAEQESLTLNSIAHTLAACKESKIDKVRILVDGKSVESLGGHLDLNEPIEPLADVLKPGG